MPTDHEPKTLDRILTSLEEIKSLFILINQDKLQEAKQQLLPEDSIKKRVYDLCDGNRTTSDIANAIQKSNDYVFSYLSILRREGLVRTVEKDAKQVHDQIF